MNSPSSQVKSDRHKFRSIAQQPLIGLHVAVASSTCRSYEKLRGVVLDETENMVVLEDSGKRRRVPKNTSTFTITLPDGVTINVDGAQLMGRVEDRMKRFPRGWA